MGFFSNLWHDITHPVQTVKHVVGVIGNHIGEVAAVAAAIAAPELLPALGLSSGTLTALEAGGSTLLNAISSPISSLVSGGASALSSIGNAVSGGLVSSLGNAINSIGTVVTDVVKPIQSFVNSASSVVSGLESDIKKPLDAVTGLANSINDNLIKPIVTPIETAVNQYKTLATSIHTDIQQGLQGILKVPGQIADALTSTDASLGRAINELGTQNQSIVEKTLAPALRTSGEVPLGKLSDAVAAGYGIDKDNAVFSDLTKLSQPQAPADVAQWIANLTTDLEDPNGFFTPIIKLVRNVLYGGDALAFQILNSIKPYQQDVLQHNPFELLPVNAIVDAWRRELLDETSALDELAKHGISPDRIKVLYDLLQFQFGPKEAVELKARGLISDGQYEELRRQNNLTVEQQQSLHDLMGALLSAGEAVSARHRGLVDDNTLKAMLDALRVPDSLQGIVEALAVAVTSPASVTRTSGRREVAATGFFSDTLGSVPPQYVSDAYVAAQLPGEQAELDWLAHWELPGPEWWIQAYFRGIRTRTEVEAAFRAHNIPQDAWDDMFVNAEELPPVWLVPDIIASGVWKEDDAVAAFKKLGFSDANAKVLYDYGYSKSKAGKATTAADLQKLSLSNAQALFDDGTLTPDQYTEVLLAHGYDPESATLTVELAQIKAQQAARKAYAENLVSEVELGLTTVDAAVSNLYQMGFTQAEAATYQLKMIKATRVKAKIPSEAQLAKMLKDGVLSIADWEAAMELHGYSAYWVSKLAQIQ